MGYEKGHLFWLVTVTNFHYLNDSLLKFGQETQQTKILTVTTEYDVIIKFSIFRSTPDNFFGRPLSQRLSPKTAYIQITSYLNVVCILVPTSDGGWKIAKFALRRLLVAPNMRRLYTKLRCFPKRLMCAAMHAQIINCLRREILTRNPLSMWADLRGRRTVAIHRHCEMRNSNLYCFPCRPVGRWQYAQLMTCLPLGESVRECEAEENAEVSDANGPTCSWRSPSYIFRDCLIVSCMLFSRYPRRWVRP